MSTFEWFFYVSVAALTLAVRHYVGPELWYRLLYVWKPELYGHRKIQGAQPTAQQLAHERRWNLYSAGIDFLIAGVLFAMYFAGVGKYYFAIADYGWLYAVGSFVALMVMQDLYYYVTHRLMHRGWLYRAVHSVHHKSKNPTPWSAHSVHPLEKTIELSFYPLAVLLLPLHPGVILLFWLFLSIVNLTGHAGFEYDWLKVRVNSLSWWGTTSTFHNMHHQHVNCNYALYFSFWDKILGTEHADYAHRYESLLAQSPATAPRAAKNPARV